MQLSLFYKNIEAKKMKKNLITEKMWIVLGLTLIALLSLAAVYANPPIKSTGNKEKFDMMDMSDPNAMDKMHKDMTKGLEPGVKKQINKMHEVCMKHLKDSGMHDDSEEDGMGMM